MNEHRRAEAEIEQRRLISMYIPRQRRRGKTMKRFPNFPSNLTIRFRRV